MLETTFPIEDCSHNPEWQSLIRQAETCMATGDLENARVHTLNSLDLANNTPQQAAVSLGLLSLSCRQQGRLKEALLHKQAQIKLVETKVDGMHRLIPALLISLSILYRETGNDDLALSVIQRAIDTAERNPAVNRLYKGVAHHMMGLVYEQQKQSDKALTSFSAALEVFQGLNEKPNGFIADALLHQAYFYLEYNYPLTAAMLAKDALALLDEPPNDNAAKQARALKVLAHTYDNQADREAALEVARRLIDVTLKCHGEDHVEYALALNTLAVIHLDNDEAEEAWPYLCHAMAILKEQGQGNEAIVAAVETNLQQLQAVA